MERSNSAARHRLQIARVVAHIEANLDRSFSLQELAEIACISRFHFTRTFGQLVGFSPMALARHLRLRRAADALRSGRMSIVAAAGYAGYSGATAFSRACRAQLGASPADLRAGRRPGGHRVPGFSVVRMPLLRSAGLRFAGTHGEIEPALDPLAGIAMAYGAWTPGAGVVLLVHDGEPLAIPGRNWLEADIGIPMLSAVVMPNRYHSLRIPPGPYAALHQHGSDDGEALRQYRDCVELGLPAAGLKRGRGPVVRWHRYDPALRPGAMREWWLLVPLADDTPLAAYS